MVVRFTIGFLRYYSHLYYTALRNLLVSTCYFQGSQDGSKLLDPRCGVNAECSTTLPSKTHYPHTTTIHHLPTRQPTPLLNHPPPPIPPPHSLTHTYRPTHLLTYPPTRPHTRPPTRLPTRPPAHPHTRTHTHTHTPTHTRPHTHAHTHTPTHRHPHAHVALLTTFFRRGLQGSDGCWMRWANWCQGSGMAQVSEVTMFVV